MTNTWTKPSGYDELPKNSKKMVDSIITAMIETTDNAHTVLLERSDQTNLDNESAWDATFCMLLAKWIKGYG